MLAIQGAILAIAAAFLAAVDSVSLTHVPFYETMSQGGSVTIAEHGPFTFFASCDSLAVQLNVIIEGTEEDYIFSDQGSPENLLAGNTSSYNGVFRETSYGNDYADGGFVSASGYYVAWDGESVIGLHMPNGATQDIFGDTINCVVSGVVKLIEL